MFVYIWKTASGTPFYVGFSKTRRRANPCAAGGRGWLCKKMLAEIGPKNVVVEIHTVESIEQGIALERKFIADFGRIQTGTGPLSNLRAGGEGTGGMSASGKASLREHMLRNNPMRNPETREKMLANLRESAKRFIGENNPAKRPEVREKLKALWATPEFREKIRVAKLGRHPNLSESRRAQLRVRALDPNGPLFNTHRKLNSDPLIAEKRQRALRDAGTRSKISTSNKAAWAEKTPSEKASQLRGLRQPKSPETRARMSAAAKLRWAEGRCRK